MSEFELTPVHPRSRLWLNGLIEGCDRFVHARTVDRAERARLARLVLVLFCAPFVVAPAVMATMIADFGAGTAAAGLCAIFFTFWALAVMVGHAASLKGAGLAALGVGAALLAIAAGASSSPLPLMFLACALPVEAWWVARSRTATKAGLAAGAAVVGATAILPGAGVETALSSWLAVAAYGATLWARASDVQQEDADEAAAAATAAEDLDAVLMRFGADGAVEWAGPRAERLLGLSPELMAGNAFFERLRVPDRVAYLCALRRALAGEAGVSVELNLRLPAQAGAVTHRCVALDFLPARAGGSVCALLRDASEIAALREQVLRLTEETEGLESAKSRFLAAVSHELRTPLNAIIGFSDMLLHEAVSGPLPPRQSEQVGLIREAGHHLLAVVNSILDVSKIEAGTYDIHLEPFRLADALELCSSLMEEQARQKGVALHLDIDEAPDTIHADQRAVQQILINLLSNAVKFTPQGGLVTLSARACPEGLAVEVSDTGIGISQADIAMLGRPFMQIQNDYTRRYEGTGLGLSLVKGLVALHHGSLEIESAPARGTIMRIMLPQPEGGPLVSQDEAGRIGKIYEACRKIA